MREDNESLSHTRWNYKYHLTTSRKCALEISFNLLDNFHYREELRIRNPKSVDQCRGNEKEDSQQYSINYRRKST
ncbi:TPA: hypothetical protein ACGO5G_001947 [Streptococcus suis]